MNALESQLADLRIYANELEAKLQNEADSAPTVPPKQSKAPQPQVPQSCSVKSTCEPRYSSRLECASRNSSAYSSVSARLQPRARSGDALLYSNLLPPGGTTHVYGNVPYNAYSELRRAPPAYPPSSTRDFSTYGGSLTSSTYESLYEPINPRPGSQLSGRSASSLYAGYVSDAPPPPAPMVSAADDGQLYCGNCYNCGERIMGETTGCTAMDRIYHIRCFRCQQCGVNLQGRPFYALNGRALCETDYLNTLEKCCVCNEPILDRILRATGKPYHPHCFTCVVCQQSLDGIPFTVDAANRIHCIEDFHKRYAPRCARCREPVVPEPGAEETVRIVALDSSYHIKCYACEDCGVSLSSRQEGRGCYPLDNHLYCRSCNAARIQELTRNITN